MGTWVSIGSALFLFIFCILYRELCWFSKTWHCRITASPSEFWLKYQGCLRAEETPSQPASLGKTAPSLLLIPFFAVAVPSWLMSPAVSLLIAVSLGERHWQNPFLSGHVLLVLEMRVWGSTNGAAGSTSVHPSVPSLTCHLYDWDRTLGKK